MSHWSLTKHSQLIISQERMALKTLSAEQKAALAKIVAPETLDDIEEYIRPQFPPRKTSLGAAVSATAELGNDISARRRIVQDGHGRWREIRPQVVPSSNSLQTSSCLRHALMKVDKSQWTKGFYVEQPKSKFVNSSGETLMYTKNEFDQEILYTKKGGPEKEQLRHDRVCTNYGTRRSNEIRFRPLGSSCRTNEKASVNYDNISMYVRSNVFPGLGNNNWNSTTTDDFTNQVVPPAGERAKFFGIQTDGFGKWSAANVHHERMKKKWDEYLLSLPKQAATWKTQESTEITPKVKKPEPPQSKVKKSNPKPKPKKNEEAPPNSHEKDRPQDNQIESAKPSIDGPNDDGDNFWDFYDKPFNKPM